MAYIYPDDPYFGGIKPHQSRRGTTAQVSNYVPAAGELVFSTDVKKIYVGDGTTPGGILVSGSGSGNNFDFGTILQPFSVTTDFGTI
jgi:hypothetical protein